MKLHIAMGLLALALLSPFRGEAAPAGESPGVWSSPVDRQVITTHCSFDMHPTRAWNLDGKKIEEPIPWAG